MQSLNFFIRRLLVSIPTIIVIATLVFLLMHNVPGGPFDSDKALPPEIKKNIDAKFKLDQPLYMQYYDYFKGILLHGDFGPSYKYLGRNVEEIIAESFPKSLELGFYSMLIAVLIGIPMGILSAYKHNTWIDHTSMFFAVAGQALPSFFVAALLILVFAYHLGWLPAALWGEPEHIILPAFTLGIRPSAYIARLTRSSILETIRADFVRTARAKGLGEGIVILKHVLKNSLIPTVTALGPITAGVVAGSFVIEQVFAIPGLGKHFVTSVTNRDYSLIMGTTLVYAVLVVTANILVDLTYAIVDPRIKLS